MNIFIINYLSDKYSKDPNNRNYIFQTDNLNIIYNSEKIKKYVNCTIAGFYSIVYQLPCSSVEKKILLLRQ